MQLHYYPETDSLYIELSDTLSVNSIEVAPGMVVDFDNQGKAVGIDLDPASPFAMIFPFGVWVYFAGHEYFLDYDNFPWFKNARVREVMNVQALSEEHLYWPDLDIDLHLDSIKNPQMYPLIYQAN